MPETPDFSEIGKNIPDMSVEFSGLLDGLQEIKTTIDLIETYCRNAAIAYGQYVREDKITGLELLAGRAEMAKEIYFILEAECLYCVVGIPHQRCHPGTVRRI